MRICHRCGRPTNTIIMSDPELPPDEVERRGEIPGNIVLRDPEPPRRCPGCGQEYDDECQPPEAVWTDDPSSNILYNIE